MINWDAIGAIGEVVGAGAVVVTLLYLAKQIHNANTLGKAESERDWLVGWTQITRELSSEPAIADIMLRGFSNYASLSKIDQLVFHSRMGAMVDHAELLRQLDNSGLVHKSWLPKVLDAVASFIRSEGGAAWWDSNKRAYEINEFLDEYLRTSASRIPPVQDYMPVWKL